MEGARQRARCCCCCFWATTAAAAHTARHTPQCNRPPTNNEDTQQLEPCCHGVVSRSASEGTRAAADKLLPGRQSQGPGCEVKSKLHPRAQNPENTTHTQPPSKDPTRRTAAWGATQQQNRRGTKGTGELQLLLTQPQNHPAHTARARLCTSVSGRGCNQPPAAAVSAVPPLLLCASEVVPGAVTTELTAAYSTPSILSSTSMYSCLSRSSCSSLASQ